MSEVLFYEHILYEILVIEKSPFKDLNSAVNIMALTQYSKNSMNE